MYVAMCPYCKKSYSGNQLQIHNCKERTDHLNNMAEKFSEMFPQHSIGTVLTVEPDKSARFNDGKVQVREIDPAFLIGIGEVLTASRAKYDEGNWMKETKFSTPYESCMRHMMKFWSGQEMDEETTKHHLLHAATNLMFLYYHQTSGKGVDDRLFKKKKTEMKLSEVTEEELKDIPND